MPFHSDLTESEFLAWLDGDPSEDDLRGAYLALEVRRANLWVPGHLDSFRRDRYELDARYVARLVAVKGALARSWVASGQVDPTLVAGPMVRHAA